MVLIPNIDLTSVACNALYSSTIPAYFLGILQCRALAYIWSKIRPCVSKVILYCPKLQDRLGLPHFAKYYQAAQLAKLTNNHATHGVRIS